MKRDSTETYRGLVRRALPSMIPAYLALAIPPNPGVRVGPFIVVNICVAILIALIVIGRRWDGDGRYPTQLRLATTGAAVTAIGFAMAAFEGRETTVVPLFFVVIAFGAAMGGRLQLIFAWTSTVVAYGLGSLAAGADAGYVASSALLVGSAAACLQICVRFAVTRVGELAERNDLQRRIAAAAAHADDLDRGLAEMTPLAARLLNTGYLATDAVSDAGGRRELTCIGRPAPDEELATIDLGPTAGDERVIMTVGLGGRPADEDLAIVSDLLIPLVARSRYVAHLEHVVASDALTGVASRRELTRVLERLHAEGRPHVVVMMDVDGLKEHNDTLGHQAGDDVLARAGALLSRLGPKVTAARYGGDEFLLVFEGEGLTGARTTVHRLAADWDEAIPVGVSFGIAEWDGRESTERLIERADAELYVAKRSTREPSAR